MRGDGESKSLRSRPCYALIEPRKEPVNSDGMLSVRSALDRCLKKN